MKRVMRQLYQQQPEVLIIPTVQSIQIWRFYDAPAYYQEGFDEDDADWLAFIPLCYADEYLGFLAEGSSFGCCRVAEKEIEGGIIRVGYHA